jgi:hypothetical protein
MTRKCVSCVRDFRARTVRVPFHLEAEMFIERSRVHSGMRSSRPTDGGCWWQLRVDPPFLALVNDFIPWQFLAVSADSNTEERRGVVVTTWVRNSAKKLVFLVHISHVGSKAQFVVRFLLIVPVASSTLKIEAVCSSETSINFYQTTLSHSLEGSALHVFHEFPQLLKTNGVILCRVGT